MAEGRDGVGVELPAEGGGERRETTAGPQLAKGGGAATRQRDDETKSQRGNEATSRRDDEPTRRLKSGPERASARMGIKNENMMCVPVEAGRGMLWTAGWRLGRRTLKECAESVPKGRLARAGRPLNRPLAGQLKEPPALELLLVVLSVYSEARIRSAHAACTR